jgi:hypothetical protein
MKRACPAQRHSRPCPGGVKSLARNAPGTGRLSHAHTRELRQGGRHLGRHPSLHRPRDGCRPIEDAAVLRSQREFLLGEEIAERALLGGPPQTKITGAYGSRRRFNSLCRPAALLRFPPCQKTVIWTLPTM